MPLVSVIIPNYNHSPYLVQRIDSVLNQTFQDFEVIILDDCSTDNSREIIEPYRNHPKVMHIEYNTINSCSPFRQWKKGIDLAKGEYIWIAESDDWADINLLEEAIKAYVDSEIDLVYFKSIRVNSDNIEIDQLAWWYDDLSSTKWKSDYTTTASEEIRNALMWKCTIVNASAVVFKLNDKVFNLLESIKDFKKTGDWLFWLSYLNDSNKIQYLTSAKNYFRYHNNTTRNSIPYDRNTEILKIYQWICTNILNKKEDWNLLKYFIEKHIYFQPRRYILKNLIIVLSNLKYSAYFSLGVLLYYLGLVKNK